MSGCPTVLISSAADPRLDLYRSLREQQLAVIEGLQQLEVLLKSPLPICGALLEERHVERFAARIAARLEPGAVCYSASRDVLSELVGYRLHNGAIALTRPKPETPLAELRAPIVALDGLVDAENVGSIARSCAAFGVPSLLVDSKTAHPLLRRAIRVSLASSLFLDICRVEDLPGALLELAKKFEIVGIEQSERAESLTSARFGDKSVLVFGNEGRGLAPAVLECCSRIVSIPMEQGVVSSLNVSASAALVLGRSYFGTEICRES